MVELPFVWQPSRRADPPGAAQSRAVDSRLSFGTPSAQQKRSMPSSEINSEAATYPMPSQAARRETCVPRRAECVNELDSRGELRAHAPEVRQQDRQVAQADGVVAVEVALGQR